MKLFATIMLAGALLVSTATNAAEAKSDPKVELEALIGKIRTGLQSGKRTAKALSSEIKAFDTLLAKYKGQKTDDVAGILFMKAMLHVEVFADIDAAVPMLKQLKKDFPATKPGKDVDRMLVALEQRRETMKVQASMAEGKVFPDFSAKDMAGKPLSVGRFKGKVVLVDFWATWCGPCIAEMPNVIKAYDKYHQQGFEVIGISLDQSRDKLVSYTKENKMTWPQYFDGLGWKNKLAQKYGISGIPATFLIGPDGKIIGKNLRGHALEAAVGQALAKK
jgi:thiol-disulfide isomerase/thioredoxin